MKENIIDREYAIYMNLPNNGGKQEIGIGSQTLADAKKEAMDFIENNNAHDVTIKLYSEGDISHQWDYKNGSWIQYE